MEERQGVWYYAEYNSILIIVASAGALFFVLWRGSISEENFIFYWLAGFLIFFLMILCFSLKFEIDQENVYLIYGIGLITTEFPIFSIAEAGPVPNESIFSLPYDPRGKGAIRIVLRDGKKYTLPSERPKELAQALLQRSYRG